MHGGLGSPGATSVLGRDTSGRWSPTAAHAQSMPNLAEQDLMDNPLTGISISSYDLSSGSPERVIQSLAAEGADANGAVEV
jgi:hypothetical protein